MNKLRQDGSFNFSGSFSKNYSSSLYSLIGQKAADIEKVPIYPSTLKFKDPKAEQKFIQSLYCNSDPILNASNEFKFNLIMLYVFISAYVVATALQDLFLFREFRIPTRVYIFKTVFLGILSAIFFSVLNAMLKSLVMLKRATEIFTFLAFIIISFVVLTDPRVISAVSSSPEFKLEIFHSTLCVFLLVSGFSRLLFENFFNVLMISFFAFTSSSVSLILSAPNDLVQTIPEVLFLLIGLVTVCFNCHKHSVFSRDYFWRNEIKSKNIEELSEFTELNDLGSKNYINTEIELLVQLCEKIKKCIKGAYSLLIFKDVKAKLKVALNELDNLKKRITGDIFKHAVFVGEAELMDEQDRTFINQFFMQFSHKSANNYSKMNTLRDCSESSPTSFFNRYGIRNFEKALEAIGTDWAFDIWFIYQSTGHNIYILSRYLSEKWGISQEFSISEDVFDRFFQTVEKVRNIQSYHHNPYHNSCHAGDVLHNFMYFCYYGNLLSIMTPLETLGCILSAVCHDISHPALTNRFLIQNRDDLAIQYNDTSVLENMHASTTFNILNKPSCNILENLNQEDWFKIRRIVLNLILDTDLSRHFEILGRFRAKTIDMSQFDVQCYENKQLIFSMGLKCADLGHSAKNIDLHQKWSALICEEYFRQGDLEKLRKQEISMYCDRETTDIPKSQATFIKNICLPLYDTWGGFLNCDVIRLTCIEQLGSNLNYWTNKAKSEKNGEVLSPEL